MRRCSRGRQQLRLPWQAIISSLAAPGIASGLDVGLSNWAVSLITISLYVINNPKIHQNISTKITHKIIRFRYTMTKSTTIIFILGFALVFKLEKKVIK